MLVILVHDTVVIFLKFLFTLLTLPPVQLLTLLTIQLFTFLTVNFDAILTFSKCNGCTGFYSSVPMYGNQNFFPTISRCRISSGTRLNDNLSN